MKRDDRPALDEEGRAIPGMAWGFSMSIESVERHGLTWDEYHRMLNAQDCRCAICRSHEPLVIDHDHKTGVVRALLCKTCNSGIGMLADDAHMVGAASSYLGKHEVAA